MPPSAEKWGLSLFFHPLVGRWFAGRFAAPSPAQQAGWPCIAAGRDTLIAAPTGSGKTLAAFLWSIHRLVERAAAGALPDATCVVYVSPLKALGNDVQKNLQEPLGEIRALAASEGLHLGEIRVAVRTGDTPAADRQRMRKRPPHILITTPESLYILLTAEGSRAYLKGAEAVIVDEIHAVAADKRGAHLALSLERLDALAGRRLQRIGLSATQKPIEAIGRLLVGAHAADPAIVDVGHRRAMHLEVEVPDQELGPIATHELWSEVYDRIAARIRAHRTTLVFVNTRRLVERAAHALGERLGEDRVAAHHGSLSRERRLEAEQKLKCGEIAVLVATASLELGIDVGHVDVVCHVGAPRAIATLLQRVGRSGHWLGATPRGVLYPMTRDDLVQCAAAVRAVRRGELDSIEPLGVSLDVLAQQMVATVASETEDGIPEDRLYERMRGAWPFRSLTRADFERIVAMLSDGVAGPRGRKSALLHRDGVHGTLRPRRGARLVAIGNGGAIPDTADYDVLELPAETLVGRINEDFAIESMAGDVFLLGNRSWRIRRVSAGRVFVEDAPGAAPTVPFWLGEAPARTEALSRSLSELREGVARRLGDPEAAAAWLLAEADLSRAAAEAIVAYVRETVAALGCVPSMRCVVAERFFDEGGGMQLVLHAPFGARINRAWGLALRKRFCVTFDFELQASATDDGVVISLGERHSFPLDSVFGYVRSHTLSDDLTQAAFQAPVFAQRFRWNATRALAVARTRSGKKVPMQIQRMRAEDLLAAVFPEATMCQDNRSGPIVPNDHPLVEETLRDCLHRAMDLTGMQEVALAIEEGRLRCVAVETASPSQMSHELLNANPYAFLDDAPLEERRARAVALRRTDAIVARGIGALSAEAVEEVRRQAWPQVRDAHELHDFLLSVGLLPEGEAAPWIVHALALRASGRATLARYVLEDGTARAAWVAAERIPRIRAIFPDVALDPPSGASPPETPEAAVRAVVHGWMDALGPTTAAALAARCGLSRYHAQLGLAALESAGVVLQGHFTQDVDDAVEWCERGLLARIHRLTLGALRREIEAVTPADFMRFLLRWQHVAPGTRLHGREGVLQVVRQLQGLELPARAWEEHVLPARLAAYDPLDLETLCLGGTVTWGRLRPGAAADPESPLGTARDGARSQTARSGRAGFSPRQAAIAMLLREDLPWLVGPLDEADGLSVTAQRVLDWLERRGASFLLDVARGVGETTDAVERSLWELVRCGRVSADGIAGLRALLRGATGPRSLRRHGQRHLPQGRWCAWRGADEAPPEAERLEAVARQWLRRYGVVFRDLLVRELQPAPWRTFLQIYRRLEARGEIRGGRFVSGFVGEQFALAEAVDALRAVRRVHDVDEVVTVAAADPLNLVGILTPGGRVSPYLRQTIPYVEGIPREAASA